MDSLFASHTATIDRVEDNRIAARMVGWDPRYSVCLPPTESKPRLSLFERARQLGLLVEAQLDQADPSASWLDLWSAESRELAAIGRLSGHCPGNCFDCPVEHPEACIF